MTTELEQLRALDPGDHLCLLHESEEERLAALTPFLLEGLARGERCIYVAHQTEGREVLRALREAGADIDGAVRRAAFVVVSTHEAHLRDGRFDPDRMLALLADESRRARGDGFAGLRLAGEMAWAVGPDPGQGFERLIEYEARVNDVLRECRATAICQYDRRRFPASVQRDVLRTHPIVVLGDQVCANLYYEPARMVLGEPGGEERVQWMLGQLRSARASQRRCEEVLAERERLLLELRSSDQRKDEFLAMLGHELRNPLGAISNGLQVLRRRSKGDTSTSHERELLERQVRHMARLLDDLLDVSRITRGLTQLEREQIDLAGVVARAVATTAPLVQLRRHQLALSLPPEPVPVEGDGARLEQILANLLSNAARYTEPGGHIWLSLRREEGQAVISVRDTGVGLAPEFLPQIFDMFSQGKRTLDRSQGGLGVGLTLARRLAELHGGTLEAFSEGVGKGSEFVVRLPALLTPLSSAPPERLADESQRAGSGAPTVLLVEDNVDAAAMLYELLCMLGYRVHVAHDGPSGLELAAQTRPDVALLDLGLPGMDGYEVAQRLRRDPRHSDALLVALTGYGQDSDRHRSREAGFDHHLVKPVDVDELDRVIGAAKERRGESHAGAA